MSSPGAMAPMGVGRYAMYDAIGSGGMATVHLGRLVGDEGFGRTVAIKRLRPHLAEDADVVRAFLDEARLATRIRHPNVVPTIDVVATQAEVFLVMEYVDGESMSQLAARASAREELVPPQVVVAVGLDALRGLHAAHEAVSESGEPLHIVHRDVSPQNILVGTDGVARVLDFGVAKALGRQQTTQDGRVKGKYGYMAPEQVVGQGVTRRTDVFAMGVVLWELLAGRRLFRAGVEAETVARVLFSEVVPPTQANPQAPAALDAVVLRALERDPIKRFASAEDMALALEKAMTPATTRAVAEWVHRVADESLEERARQVRDIEAHSATRASAPHPGPVMLEPANADVVAREGTLSTLTASAPVGAGRARRGRVALLSGGAIAVAVAAAGSAWWTRGARATPATAPVVASAAQPVVEAPPADLSSAVAAPAPVPAAPTTTAAPAAAAPRPPKPSPPLPRMAPAPAGSPARERLYTRD